MTPFRSLLHRDGLEALTRREIEILELYPEYGYHAAIAEQMGLAESTVKNYASSIITKLGVHGLGQAAILWYRYRSGDGRLDDRRSGRERRIRERRK